MLPAYKVLLQRGLSILVFSGDVDAIVPVRQSPHVAAAPCLPGLGLCPLLDMMCQRAVHGPA